jgi:hypothetical protein
MTARRFLPPLSLFGLALVASPSMAADSDAPAADPAAAAAAAPTPDWTFPGSVDIASDYIFRGLTQTNR